MKNYSYCRVFLLLLLSHFIYLTGLHVVARESIEVGYLVDYHFAILDGNWQLSGPQSKISDWDINSKAGTIDYVYWNYFTINDTSTTSGFEMRKMFLKQSTGTISVEFKVSLPAKIDGLEWALRSERGYPLIKFLTSGGDLGYENYNGEFVSLISNYSAGQIYAIHTDVTLPNISATIYINGVRCATGNVFRNLGETDAGQFYIGTPAAPTGVMRFYYLTIIKGYKLFERFTNATAGAVPASWTATAAGGIASVQVQHGSNAHDTMSFKIEDTSPMVGGMLTRSFAASAGKLVWEFKFMLPVKVDGIKAQLLGGTSSAVTITTAGGGLSCLNSEGRAIELWANYKPNLWYVVRVIANPSTQTADIYVNGKLKGVRAPFPDITGTIDNVLFSTSVAGVNPLLIDDIYVYDFQEEPTDYVPPVQSVSSRGYMVGTQSFFTGWREGHHCGWDWIYRYPTHDPLLGWFDNGNPEAMDWQMKWMAEAGINFFLDCWYRNTDGNPMKEPKSEYTEGPIHNGYFYGKYSDKVRFAIADYSLLTATEADFTSNILPYWIEYYFKDSRYFIVPGPTKGYPVISLGSATTWVNAPNNAMKYSIAALRAALQAEGFDGVLVLASYSGTSKATMDALYAAGIDYCYAYWGGNVIANTQNNLIAQRDTASLLKPIANAGQGKSGEAWDVVFEGGGYTSLMDFYGMSVWMRDVFLPSATLSGLLSSSMVLYDNWNEYGEGHYICPTNLERFGYLDQICAAYTTATKLADSSPTAKQKARFNVLYSRGREGRVWAFDSLYPDTEGWVANAAITDFSQSKGYLEGAIAGIDASIVSQYGYAIEASTYKRIKIRMKNSSSATSAKIYFITTSDTIYSESKSKAFLLTPSDRLYTEYSIDMSTVPSWDGFIQQIRLDLAKTGFSLGSFSVDYIKIVDPRTAENYKTALYDELFSQAPSTVPSGWIPGAGSLSSNLSSEDNFSIDTTNGLLRLQDYPPHSAPGVPITIHTAQPFDFKATGDKVIRLTIDAKIQPTLSSVNLSQTETVTTSSIESESYSGANAVDGDSATRWSSSYSDPQWIVVDLGNTYSISEIRLNWEVACGKNYLIQTSVDGNVWTTQRTITGNTTVGIIRYPVTASTRYVRVYGTARATSYGYSLYELQVISDGSGSGTYPTYSFGLFDNTSSTYDAGTNSVVLWMDPNSVSDNLAVLTTNSAGVSRVVGLFSAPIPSLINAHLFGLQLDYTKSDQAPTVSIYSDSQQLGTVTLNGSEGLRRSSIGSTQCSAIRIMAQANSTTDGGANLSIGRVVVTSFTIASSPIPLAAVSRRSHGSSGNFDIPLPISVGAAPVTGVGVECRTGNAANIVISFDKAIVSLTPSLSVGAATVEPPIYDMANKTVTIPLTSVMDGQRLQLNLTNINAQDGGILPSAIVAFAYLIGDVNGSGAVNASDISLVKAASGTTQINPASFTKDVNCSGAVNASDISLVKAASGAGLN